MAAPGLSYHIQVDRPQDHLAHVSVVIPCPPGAGAVEVALPAWCPGSYLIRDYARHLRDLRAFGDDDRPRAAIKLDKSTWSIDPAGAASVRVEYAVYGHDLSVRTNHIDDTHAFLHGPATFLAVDALRGGPVTVEITAPTGRGWRVATALDGGALAPAAARYTLRAESLDALYDAPIHLGHVEDRSFTVGGVPFELAIWGARVPGGAFTVDQLVDDLIAIASDQARRIDGEGGLALPFARYTFLLMLSHDAYGGLEHRAGSANLYNPQALSTRKQYEGLLELLSHELFHAWNGKRIAPAPLLGALDYRREAYTRCLWVMEGLTSHYDRFTLRSAARITSKSFLDKVLDDWARLQATPGRARASLEDSSFDAWIKLYKPDESNLNTTVSYYLKGGLVALALDLEVRRRSDGARSLDDVLRLLWRRHGAVDKPHPEDVQPLFEEATGLELGDFFARYIRGVDDPPLVAELMQAGLELRAVADPSQVLDGATPVWLGATIAGVRITGVLDGSPAAAAGLSVGDELCALDSFRIASEGDARAHLGARRPGETVEVAHFRRGRLLLTPVVLEAAPPHRYELVARADASTAEQARYTAWLFDAFPSGDTLAVISTITRSL